MAGMNKRKQGKVALVARVYLGAGHWEEGVGQIASEHGA